MSDIFSEMYEGHEHGEPFEIARFSYAFDDGDPDAPIVIVKELRFPASFYEIHVSSTSQTYQLNTGSGSEIRDLALRLAKEIARNMVGLYQDPTITDANSASREELEAAAEFVADFNDHEFHRQELGEERVGWADSDTMMHYRQDYPLNCDL